MLESEEKITLVVIGTHTNIAILFKMYPEVKERIEEIFQEFINYVNETNLKQI